MKTVSECPLLQDLFQSGKHLSIGGDKSDITGFSIVGSLSENHFSQPSEIKYSFFFIWNNLNCRYFALLLPQFSQRQWKETKKNSIFFANTIHCLVVSLESTRLMVRCNGGMGQSFAFCPPSKKHQIFKMWNRFSCPVDWKKSAFNFPPLKIWIYGLSRMLVIYSR